MKAAQTNSKSFAPKIKNKTVTLSTNDTCNSKKGRKYKTKKCRFAKPYPHTRNIFTIYTEKIKLETKIGMQTNIQHTLM